MYKYFSTYISGLGKTVESALKSHVKDVHILENLDGLIVYESGAHFKDIQNLPFFSNSFILLQQFENGREARIDSMLKWAINDRDIYKAISGFNKRQNAAFRIILSKENQMVPGFGKETEIIENKLKKFRIRINRSQPDYEIWFVERTEGQGFLGIRITRHPDYKTILQKGELRPELTFLMNYLSEPKREDVMLDPFAGSGAIPISRAEYFPGEKIIAGDKNISNIEKKLPGTGRYFENLDVLRLDATNLEMFENNSVDKIVTDPPWGIFEEVGNIEEFYETFMKEFIRILIPNGILIILTAQKELLEEIAENNASLKIESKEDILVSGKKSGLYKIRKL